jgi:adenylate cyclase class 2
LREVEVKYAVPDAEVVASVLVGREIVLDVPVFQDDQAFAPAAWDFGDSKMGVSFLRLRTVGGHHWFALKQPMVNAQDCLEYETEVADREEMHHAVLLMGYRPTVRVAKARRTGRHAEMSLCLDDVEGAGAFLELERLVPDDADAAAVQEELAAFVASLGIEAVRTTETYDSLVRAAQEGSVVRFPSSRASTESATSAATSSAV